MSRRFIFLGLAAFLTAGSCWGTDLPARLFSQNALPTGCEIISGLFPVGDRTDLIWQYERYSMVMPPYKKKLAQSLQCGTQKGTLYFFDYVTEAQKDHALLFARPVLAKQQGISHELPTREWATGFVLVSFPETPPELMTSLDERLNAKTAAPPPTAVAVKTAHEAWTPVAASETPARVIKSAPLPKIADNVKPALSTATVSSEPFAELKPSIADHPFESNDHSKSIQSPKTVEPSLPPIKEATPAPSPIKPVKALEPPHERKRPAPSTPAAVAVKPVAAPPGGTADLSSSVLESYASKMGCENSERNAQTQTVCGFLQEFASGLPPELPFKTEPALIGPVYTVDANGRFTDLHYDALVGTRDPGVVSFFAFPSTGGKDDFEIKQLMEARKAKTPLPENEMKARLPALAAAKRLGVRKTTARSAVIQPTPDMRLFIRRAGDHWIAIGVSGNSSEAQMNASLTVSVLY